MKKDCMYLEKLIESIIYTPNAFKINLGNGKSILSIVSNDKGINEYFAISAIYDTIIDIDRIIKYAFAETTKYNLPETLDEYNPLSKPSEMDIIALYHIENIVFRISVLWDLLAQICNIIFHTDQKPEKIYYNKYFRYYENSFNIAKDIISYFDEEDNNTDKNPWLGNHAFLNEYRNQMTHRISPSITTISTFGSILRPPAMYILHRSIEDYYVVSSYLCRVLNDYTTTNTDWPSIKL
ncbi:MAG: Cthe_2314 family HEPN domain-containing protein [Oscillospiraceae bacterium]|nr:Cthe_2314 family HEPN domain-containing protein [Oscillospiraceae bacterium]